MTKMVDEALHQDRARIKRDKCRAYWASFTDEEIREAVPNKRCPDCGKKKSSTEFSISRTRSDGLQGSCKLCLKRRIRRIKLMKNHGMTVEQWDTILAAQGGCAICGGSDRLAVDHNHTTGRIRGILCLNCNVGLGNFFDDIQRLRAAIKYLKRDTGCPV